MEIVYVRATIDETSAKTLAKAILDAGVPNPVPAERMHVTVLYSATEPKAIPAETAYPFQATPTGVETWDVEGKQSHLVMLIDCLGIVARRRRLVELGAKNERETFRPHVTLSKNIPPDFDATAILLPKTIVIEKETVERRTREAKRET